MAGATIALVTDSFLPWYVVRWSSARFGGAQVTEHVSTASAWAASTGWSAGIVLVLIAATLAALHDLNLAAMFCDTIGPARGRIVAAGPQLSVLAPTLLAEVYGVDVDVTLQDGRPVTTYRRPS